MAPRRAILGDIRVRAQVHLPEELQPPPWPDAWDEVLLQAALTNPITIARMPPGEGVGAAVDAAMWAPDYPDLTTSK